MKKMFAYLFMLTAFTLFTPTHTEDASRSYILKVSAPYDINPKAYYRGYQIDMSDQWAILPECDTQLTYSFLITSKVDIKSVDNNVRYLKRFDGVPFVWYDLTLTLNPDGGAEAYSWQVDERAPADVPVRIPDHTIILLSDPEFIQDVIAEPSLPDARNINLPTIHFKAGISEEILKESTLCTTMECLNLDAIHKKEMPLCVRRNAVIVSAAAK